MDNVQPTDQIKNQIVLLNSKMEDILHDNSELNSEALMNIADTVKGMVDVPAEELAFANAKIVSASIESSADVLKEALGSVADLKELLRTCHGILNQVYTQIASLDISDPEMISAAAAFVSSMKDTIQSFVDLYRDEQNFLHNVMLKKIDFEHKKQLIKYRHDIEAEDKTIDISSTTVPYSQEALMNIINETSK